MEDRGVKGDCTPLMEAASGGCVDIVKLLISHGADVNAQSSAGRFFKIVFPLQTTNNINIYMKYIVKNQNDNEL